MLHLVALRDRGVPNKAIADAIGFSVQAVMKMAMRLGLVRYKRAAPRRVSKGPPWASPATLIVLRAWWDEGVPTAEMSARIGVSKNAIVGRIHRLGWPSRASPIIRDPSQPRKPKPPTRVRAIALPAFTSSPVTPLALDPAGRPPKPRPRPPEDDDIPLAAGSAIAASGHDSQPVPPAPASTTFLPAPAGDCCWPIGAPGRRDFRYCDAPTEGRRPYCAAHARIAYTARVDHRDQAGAA